MRFPRSARLATLALALVAACRSAEREPGAPMQIAVAMHEALEELPGVVLSGRHFVLDGELRVAVAAPDSATARAALAAGFAAADTVGGLLALQSPDSEIDRINAAAGRAPVRVHPWTETLVVAALQWATASGGAYDPTVGPVLELWGFGRGTGGVPDSAHVADARRRVDWRKVWYDAEAHTVYLSEPGMVLDLRGAYKGFALDRMRDAMIAAGATSGVADLGGDHLFFGPGTESHDDLWPIDVPDPYDPTRPFARLELPAGAISTTSSYARSVVIAGQRYTHIIDPRTGYPVRGMASVTVYARDGVQADILSTGLFVHGRAGECDLPDDWEGVEAIFVYEPRPGQQALVCVTDGLRPRVKDLRPPFRPLVDEYE